ncbi:MAG: hypothetical protein LW636_10810 [Planctomycetaceae bacterium]|nr:hypothetical protein [Planctomycetaceae bacterium]
MTAEDPFALLGLARRFDLDARALRAAWMRRIASAHPDAEGGAAEAARLNEAQRALADPLSRAALLLRLGGAPATDERALPDGFLVEMMELREAADEALGDDARRDALAADARARREAALAEIAEAFAEAPAPLDAVTARRVRVGVNVVRSFDRMLEQLERERGGEAAR